MFTSAWKSETKFLMSIREITAFFSSSKVFRRQNLGSIDSGDFFPAISDLFVVSWVEVACVYQPVDKSYHTHAILLGIFVSSVKKTVLPNCLKVASWTCLKQNRKNWDDFSVPAISGLAHWYVSNVHLCFELKNHHFPQNFDNEVFFRKRLCFWHFDTSVQLFTILIGH